MQYWYKIKHAHQWRKSEITEIHAHLGLNSVCVCVCTHAFVCVCVCARMRAACRYTRSYWGKRLQIYGVQRSMLSVFLYCSPPCLPQFLRSISHETLDHSGQARLSGYQTTGILLYLSPPYQDDRHISPHLAFYMGAGCLKSDHCTSVANAFLTDPLPQAKELVTKAVYHRNLLLWSSLTVKNNLHGLSYIQNQLTPSCIYLSNCSICVL